MKSRNTYQERRASSAATTGGDPGLLLGTLFMVVCGLVGLPTLLLGIILQRITSRYSWSFALWFLLLLPSMLLCYMLYEHGLQQLIVRQFVDLIQMGKHDQLDVMRWNIGRLWSETWPVWVRTLAAVPLIGVWREVTTGAKGGQTAHTLVWNEQRRQQRLARAQQRARKRTRRPERLPDERGGLMVIGVPIEDEDQE